MCTVSYIPNNQGYILTNNRDEHIARAVTQLAQNSNKNVSVHFPLDPVGKGSWIAAASDGRVACLLNGAFVKHHRYPPYAMSRGRLLLNYFKHTSSTAFIQKSNFNNIEPFTLILLSNQNKITQIRWDGRQRFINFLHPGQAHFWSSCTLYDHDLSAQKKERFYKMLHPTIQPTNILEFHNTMKYEVLIKNKVHEHIFTTSITQIIKKENTLSMHLYSKIYQDPLPIKVNISKCL